MNQTSGGATISWVHFLRRVPMALYKSFVLRTIGAWEAEVLLSWNRPPVDRSGTVVKGEGYSVFEAFTLPNRTRNLTGGGRIWKR